MNRELAAHNQPDDILERRIKDTLNVSGLAVMAFAVWEIIRMILRISLQFRPVLEALEAEASTKEEIEAFEYALQHSGMFMALIIGVILAFGLIGLVLRIYVGRNARAVGQGRKTILKRWLFLAVVLLVMDSLSILSLIIQFRAYLDANPVLEYFITLFVGATSFYATFELTVSAFRLKKLYSRKEAVTS